MKLIPGCYEGSRKEDHIRQEASGLQIRPDSKTSAIPMRPAASELHPTSACPQRQPRRLHVSRRPLQPWQHKQQRGRCFSTSKDDFSVVTSEFCGRLRHLSDGHQARAHRLQRLLGPADADLSRVLR